MSDQYKYFTSDRNYLKKDTSSGSSSLAAPSSFDSVSACYVTRLTITHNLGYVPLFSVWYEPYKNSVIWPMMGSRLAGNTGSPSPGTGPYCIAWANSTQLIIEIGYINNSLTGTYPVYWNIYTDYSLS